MKKVVSFSGGRTSAYLCKLMIDKFGRENVDFIYMDTTAEHPKTYDFIRQVNKEFGLNLICLKAKFNTALGKSNNYEVIDIDNIGCNLSAWVDMTAKYSTPYNPSGGFCTGMLKNQPFYKYCDDTYGKDNYITWIGIRADEERRAKTRENVKYLCNISDFEKQDILNWWQEQSFDLDLDSDILGNCVFCIKRGVNKIALATKLEPELAKEFIKMVEAPTVRRIKERKASYSAMYRGKISLDGVVKMYEQHSEHDINETIRGRRQQDSECSESCEVFGCQIDEIEN